MGKNKSLRKNKALFQPQESGLGLWVTCVHPAELRQVGIERQPVRQAQVLLHENPPVRPIHVRSFNFGAISVPVCPVKIPRRGKGRERGRGVTTVGETFTEAGLKETTTKTLADVQARGWQKRSGGAQTGPLQEDLDLALCLDLDTLLLVTSLPFNTTDMFHLMLIC